MRVREHTIVRMILQCCGVAAACRRLADCTRCFCGETNGAVAIFFALAILPIAFAVGASVDYSVASRAKAKLDALADAAALSAVNKAAMSDSTKDAKADAKDLFSAQSATVKGVKLQKVTVKLNEKNSVRTATVTYQASTPAAFMGLIGIDRVAIGGTATASSATPTYIDFHLLLDNTPSMGVAATAGDINKMVSNTPDKCAFACHDQSDPKNYYALAKTLGVAMRIDVMRTATQQLMDTARDTQFFDGQFRMAIYTFGTSCTNLGLTTITALTSGLSSAKTAASAIDLMTIPYQNYNNDQCTDFEQALPAINKKISDPGDGSTSSKPQKILFFVSDGVGDSYNPGGCSKKTTSSGRCQAPLSVELCTAIKKRGIKIAVLYTTYLPLPTNEWYMTWLAPFSGEIGPTMQSCASEGLYFEVSPTEGISNAMNALFQKVVAQARLTK